MAEKDGRDARGEPKALTSPKKADSRCTAGRRKTDKKTGERSTLLQQIMDTASVAIFLVDLTGRITHANKRMAEMFGCSMDELIGSEYVAHVHPSEREIGRQRMLDLLASKIESVDLERLYWRKDGTEFWGHLTGRRFQDVRGNKLGLIGVISDIAKRKLAEDALREKENRYRTLFEGANDGIFIHDASGFVDCNQRGAEMYGLPKEKIIGRLPSEFAPERQPDGRLSSEVAAEKIQAALSGVPQLFEWQPIRADGTPFNVEITLSRIILEGVECLQAIVRDMTERKRAEEELRRSEAQTRSIIESTPVGMHMYRLEPDGRLVFTGSNPAADRILGVDNSVFVGREIEDAFPSLKGTEVPLRYREVAETGKIWHTERIEYRDNIIAGAFEVHAFQSSPGNVVAAFTDITERKRAEDALRESEAKYRRLYNETPVMLHSVDRNTLVADVNDHWLKTLGYERSEVIGRKVTDFYTEASRKYAEEVVFPAFFRDGVAKDIEYQFVKKNGELVDVVLSSVGERDAAGNVVRSQSVIVDVTERKRMEEALQQSEARYRMLYEGTPVMMHSIDAEGRLISVSDYWLKKMGYTRDEVLGRRSTEFLDEESRAYALTVVLPDFMRTGVCADVPYTFVRRNGERISTLLSAIAERDSTGKVLRSLAVIIDITERKLAEERLRESEVRFRNLVEQSPIAITIVDKDGRIGFLNRKHLEIVGFTVEEVPTLEAWWSLVYPDAETRQRVRTAWEGIAQRIFRGEDVGPVERRIVCKDGTNKDVEMRFALVGDKILVAFTDTSERKRVEKALKQSEEMFRDLAESLPLTVFEIDLQGRFTYVNRVAMERFGYSPEDVKAGLMMTQVIVPEDLDRAKEVMARRFAGTDEEYHEYRGLRKDGTTFPITVASSPILKDGRPVGLRGIIIDLTERKQLEEERLKTQKLEATGILAGGIAHDFNNLLQGIFGYIAMAKVNMDDKKRSLDLLSQAEKALHLSVNLTTQLLTFSKGGKPLKKRLHLGPVIENSVKFALSGSRTDYTLDIAEDLFDVDADEGQIAQVIQNIVLNADQAMPFGGTVRVSAGNMELPAKKQKGIPPEDMYVEIVIQDSGVGIPPQYLSSIFDPYFTTKERGSGIGLATTYSIIKNHGGMIDVQSEVGKGSIFFIYIPGIKGKEEIPVPSPEHVPLRSGKVLVMDDDEMIRNVITVMLKTIGFEAVCVADGNAALAEYRASMESGSAYDAVILDLTIRGGMGGEEAIRRLRSLDPGIRAIVSSGYSDSSIMAEYEAYGFSACLRKPYRVDEIRDVLNKLLA